MLQEKHFDINNFYNKETNNQISVIFMLSSIFGAGIYFVCKYLVYHDPFQSVTSFCAVLLVLGLLPLLLVRFRLPANYTTVIVALLISLSYIFVSTRPEITTGVTIWAVVFPFMLISVLYANRTLLVLLSISAILSTLHYVITNPHAYVAIEPSDYLGRIGIIGLSVALSFFAYNVHQKRLAQLAAAKDSIAEMAYYDELTGLPRRRALGQRIEKLINRNGNGRHPLPFAVIFIDFDNFKYINDFFGHEVGDAFLRDAGQRISRLLADEKAFVSRIGGDEFVILVEGTGVNKDSVQKIVNRILNEFSSSIEVAGYSSYMTASIGIALYPQHGENVKDLLKHADIAMYDAKKQGKQNYQFFNQTILADLQRKVQLQEALRSAVENKELVLHFQPIVNIGLGQTTEYEALLRWNSPKFGCIPPSEFIPIAEEDGSIIEIGQWVLKTAIAKSVELNRIGTAQYTIGVNVSSVQLKQSDFVEQLTAILQETGADPATIVIEITESVFIDFYDGVQEVLQRIKDLGIRISLDDFGSGYSSLYYLMQMPINILKIDRAFILAMDKNIEQAVIFKAIVDMAHNLQMKVVAEGVETAGQLAMVKDRNCDYVQGYYYGKPRQFDSIREELGVCKNKEEAAAAL